MASRAEFAELRTEFAEFRVEIDGRLAAFRADVDGRLAGMDGKLAALRLEIANGRFALIRWMFALWVAQMAAVLLSR